MFKFAFVFLCAVSCTNVLARPVDDQSAGPSTTPATILKQVDVSNPDGSYNSSYETSNGIIVENNGYLKKVLVPKGETVDGQTIDEHEEMVLVQTGSYTYTDPEGNTITLTYVADENGFQPQGDHLPVAPQGAPQDAPQDAPQAAAQDAPQ